MLVADPSSLDAGSFLSVERADAVAVAPDGTTWVLADGALHAFSSAGIAQSSLVLPVSADDDGGPHVALAIAANDIVIAAVGSEAFFVSVDGELLATLALPSPAVAAASRGARVWIAHRRGLVAVEGFGQVASIALKKNAVEDLALAENGEMWVAASKEILVLSQTGAILRSRKIAADQVAATSSGAWIASDDRLVRLSATLETVATASAFPPPANVIAIEADPRDDSVFAASKSRIRHVGPAGELLAEEALPSQNKVHAKHALATRFDRTPPSIVFVSPAFGACTGARPLLDVSFSDVGTGVDLATIGFATAAGALPVSCSVGDGSAACTPLADLPQGTVMVSATIADRAGMPNVALAASTTFVVDTIAPVVALTEPLPPALTNDPNLTFSGTVSESASITVNGAPAVLHPTLAWSHSVTLVEGANAFEVVARDCRNESRLSFAVVLDTTPPAAPDGGLIFVSESVGGIADVRGEAGSVEPGTLVTVTNMRTGEVFTTTAGADGAWFVQINADGGDALAITLRDAVGNESEATATSVPQGPGEQLPPPPESVASEYDDSVASVDFLASNSFLVEAGVQTGATPGAFDQRRASVLRVRVLASGGLALPGVRVSLLRQPEFGHTFSRADGWADLLVNAGGDLVVAPRTS